MRNVECGVRNDVHSAFRILHSALMHRLLAVLLLAPLPLAAQAAPRADTPRRGAVRITFDAVVETWDARFANGRRERLGAALTGDSVGGASLPVVARLEQDVRTAGAVPGFIASLGRGLFSLRAERRTTPLGIEFGVSDRLSIGVMLPLVRVFTRAHLTLDTAAANLGLNPLIANPMVAGPQYMTFFSQFDQALADLAQNIDGGSYGCPSGPQCAQAMAFLAEARGVRDALNRSTYGPGGAPFLPRADTDGGAGIDANVARIQQELTATWGVGGFVQTFLLPVDTLDAARFDAALADPNTGFGVAPFTTTPRRLRFWPGDAEVGARFRLARGPVYNATVGALVRLPTGHVDSPNDAIDLPAGDGQTDFEGQLVQELLVARRLWLNVNVRAGIQRPGARERRVGSPLAFLLPPGATARTEWDPGDYVALDLAPLYRFSEFFAAGFTIGYLARGLDRSTFATPQDSIDVATRLGGPVSAAVLDAGTDWRRTRVGLALTYLGPDMDAGFSIERTVSVVGAAPVPAATVFRIVLRAAPRLF